MYQVYQNDRYSLFSVFVEEVVISTCMQNLVYTEVFRNGYLVYEPGGFSNLYMIYGYVHAF